MVFYLAIKKLIVTDGTEQGLYGYGMYFLRANTKKSLGEETFQRDILTGTTRPKVFKNLKYSFVQDSLTPLQRNICFGTLKGLSRTYLFHS